MLNNSHNGYLPGKEVNFYIKSCWRIFWIGNCVNCIPMFNRKLIVLGFYFHFVVHRYSTDELKYFPMNTAMFNPPKRMGTTLANPQEQLEPETASEEDENVSTPTAFLHFSYIHYCLSSIIIHSSYRYLCKLILYIENYSCPCFNLKPV